VGKTPPGPADKKTGEHHNPQIALVRKGHQNRTGPNAEKGLRLMNALMEKWNEGASRKTPLRKNGRSTSPASRRSEVPDPGKSQTPRASKGFWQNLDSGTSKNEPSPEGAELQRRSPRKPILQNKKKSRHCRVGTPFSATARCFREGSLFNRHRLIRDLAFTFCCVFKRAEKTRLGEPRAHSGGGGRRGDPQIEKRGLTTGEKEVGRAKRRLRCENEPDLCRLYRST